MIRILALTGLLTLLLASSPAVAAADTANARGLLNALGCKGCHLLQGQGGHLAPELDRVGSHMTRERLSLMFRKPDQPAHDLTFLAEPDRASLVDFLAGLTQPAPAFSQPSPGTANESNP
ncbi:MAG: hypothetical protein D6751_03050 [Deltaproteobacteria bacterium]|nr:MAG: hypothetical protein D6751_03050 [Deltaproteobacteria bacterium]